METSSQPFFCFTRTLQAFESTSARPQAVLCIALCGTEKNYKVKTSGLVHMMTVCCQNVGWFELQHVLEKLLGFVVQIVGRRARNFCLEFLKNCLFVVCQTVPYALKPEIPSWLSIVLLPEQCHSSWDVPMGCKGAPLWNSSYKGLHTPTVKLLQELDSHWVLFCFHFLRALAN